MCFRLTTWMMTVGLIVGAVGSVKANLITDGSFEVNTNATPGNGVNSELGGHTYAGSTWGSDDVTTHWNKDPRIWYVTDGVDVEFPDGDFAYRIDALQNATYPDIDKLWQDGIDLTAGTQYVLSFDMWGESGNAILDATFTGPDTVVVFDNTTTVSNDGATERKKGLFTPTVTGSYTLNFFTDPDNGNNHTWIDDVSLDELGPNLVQDGSFEVNTDSTVGRAEGSELGNHNYAGSEWGGTDVTTYWDKDSRIWYVTDGVDTEFPDGDFAYRIDARSDINGADKLWQDGIDLTAGTEYVLSFDMWGTANNAILDATLTAGPDTLVLFDDTSSSGTDGAFETKAVWFTPTVSGSYTLSFFTDVYNGNNHAWIDRVSIQTLRVPEPSTLVLAALGLIGLALFGRRRAK